MCGNFVSLKTCPRDATAKQFPTRAEALRALEPFRVWLNLGHQFGRPITVGSLADRYIGLDLPQPIPVSTLQARPHDLARKTRDQDRFAAVLSCRALSSPTTCRLSGKAMARTGLRMMPTFPSPPLKFRTAGFPRYGFKAGISDKAFPKTGFAIVLRAHCFHCVLPALCQGRCRSQC